MTTHAIDSDELLVAMLDRATYYEDVLALKHFVFHPRLNGCSNMCNVCGYGACALDDADDLEIDGHADDCAYVRAAQRVGPKGPLEAWIANA